MSPHRRRTAAPEVRPRHPRRPAAEALESRRLLSTAALDPAYGVGGLARIDTSGPATQYSADDLVLPDGRIVTLASAAGDGDASEVVYVRRFLADGAPDPTFGTGGSVKIDTPDLFEEGGAIAAAPDGRLALIESVGVSRYSSGSYRSTAIVRLLPDGRPDPSFDGDGFKALDPLGGAERPLRVIIADDGRITYKTDQRFGRLNPDGSPDTAFDARLRAEPYPLTTIGTFAPLPGGQFLLAGSVGTSPSAAFGLCRVNADGSLDRSFGNSGVATMVPAGSNGKVGGGAPVLQPDGKIVMAGSNNSTVAVGRFNADGSVDTTFGDTANGGGWTFVADGSVSSLAVLPDGHVAVLSIFFFDPQRTAQLTLLTPAGQLDRGFDGDGSLDPHFASQSGPITVRASGGRVLAAGIGAGGEVLQRYGLDGRPDPTFGGGDGRVATAATSGQYDRADAWLPLPDGRVLIAGNSFAEGNLLYRLRPDGSPDATFGAAGRLKTDIEVSAMARDAAGRIYLAGPAAPGSPNTAVLRLLPDGAADPAWASSGAGGRTTVSGTLPVRLVVDPRDGGVILAGSSSDSARSATVHRLFPDGRLDAAFAGGTGRYASPALLIRDLALDGTGRIVAVGYDPRALSPRMSVMRLTPAGLPDVTFDGDGTRVIDPDGSIGGGASVAVLGDNRIVVGGNIAFGAVVRLTVDGALDLTFDGDGRVQFNNLVPGVTSLALQKDGRIVGMGYFEGAGVATLIRLNAEGSADPAYGTIQQPLQLSLTHTGGSSFQGGPSIGLDDAGRLLIGGTLTTREAGTDIFTARLLNDAYPATAGGPYAAPEGGAVQLTADASPNAGATIVAWDWDWDYDGSGAFTADLHGSSVTIPLGDADGPADRTVTIRTTDSSGLVSLATATLTVANASPTASSFTTSGPVVAGSSATVSFAGATDPSAADVAAGFRYSFDFDNDGTFEVGDTASASAAVPAAYLAVAGSRTVRGRVADKDGGFTDYATVITILPAPTQVTLAAAADAYVRDGTSAATNFGNATQLQVKLSGGVGSTREAYLRFDLSQVGGVTSAVLRLWGGLSTDGESVAVGAYPVADVTWGEGTVNWNNKPAAAAAAPVATATLLGAAAKWYEWDLTDYLKQQKAVGAMAVAVALKGAAISAANAAFDSDESAAAANRPQLVVKSQPADATPPAPAGLWASGTAWSSAFRGYLATAGLGDGARGFALPLAASPNVPLLPWSNLDRVTIRFNEAVDVQQGDLLIAGNRATGYTIKSFNYDATTFTATWTLAQPLVKSDRLRLSIAGGAVADLAGNPLSATAFSFDVLPGDATRDRRVNVMDEMDVRGRVGRSTASPGAGARGYSPFADLDGSGSINAVDLALARAQLPAALPPSAPEPAPTAAPLSVAPAAVESIVGTLYRDADADGVRDAGEAGLAGRTVWIDGHNNGILEDDERRVQTDADGRYAFFDLVPSGYVVRQLLPDGSTAEGRWLQTDPAGSPGYKLVTVTASQATPAVADFGSVSTADVASVAGTLWYDFDGDGLRDAGEAGVPNRLVFLDLDNDGFWDGPPTGEISAQTDANGRYAFNTLLPGRTYALRPLLPSSGFRTTAPDPAGPTAGAQVVTVAGGDVVTGRDFGLALAPFRLNASNDADVQPNGANFGQAVDMVVRASATPELTSEAYLMTTVASPYDIRSARLRLFGRLSSSAGESVEVGVFGAGSPNWQENSITWNNKPPVTSGATPLATRTVTSTAGEWYEFDLTDYFRQQKAAGAITVTLVLRGLTNTATQAVFATDESGGATRPVFAYNEEAAPPAVAQLRAGGSSWSAAFTAGLTSAGLGDADGFALPVAAASPVSLLPWANVDRFTVRFSEAVNVEADDLLVSGAAGGEYAIGAFDYDPNAFTATWTLAGRITRPDRLHLAIAAGTVTDTFGIALPAAKFDVNVLPGDANRDGRVTGTDQLDVWNRLGRSTTSPGAAGGSRGYSSSADVDGNGRIDAFDYATVRARIMTALPSAAAPTVRWSLSGLFGNQRESLAAAIYEGDKSIPK